ncbi:MAG: hypothetical protein MUP70_16960 [Candidatus Aminicenantes bacterium]|nr:hypothetical protein [Candidatus Aminicenantes bacterium]
MKKFTFVLACYFSFSLVLFGDTHGYLSFSYGGITKLSEVLKGSFVQPEAGVLLNGVLGSNIRALAEFSLESGSVPVLEQAWVGFGEADVFLVKAGVFPVPFGRYNRINRPYTTLLIEAPLSVQFFYPHRWTEFGLSVEGRLSGFSYALSAGNGLGEADALNGKPSLPDNNTGKSWGGRIGLTLFESVDVAYSRHMGPYNDAGDRNLKLEALDAHLIWGSLDVQFEWVRGQVENPEAYENGAVNGYYVILRYGSRGVVPLVSYQMMDYDDGFHGSGFEGESDPGAGIFSHRKRWAYGLSYLPVNGIVLKLEIDADTDRTSGIRSHAVTLQAAIFF